MSKKVVFCDVIWCPNEATRRVGTIWYCAGHAEEMGRQYEQKAYVEKNEGNRQHQDKGVDYRHGEKAGR